MAAAPMRDISCPAELGMAAPWVLRDLLVRCADPDVTIGQLSEIIQLDPALLSLFRAPGLAREGRSPDTPLDVAAVRFVALVAGQELERGAREGAPIAVVAAGWRESLAIGCMNRALAERMDAATARDAYLTGLLLRFGGSLSPIGGTAADGVWQRAAAWGAAAPVVNALRYSHEQTEKLLDADLLVRMSAVSRGLAHAVLDRDGARKDPAAWERAERLLGLDAASVADLVQQAASAFARLTGPYETAVTSATRDQGQGPAPATELGHELDRLATATALHDLLGGIDSRTAWWERAQLLAALLFDIRDAVLLCCEAGSKRLVAADLSPRAARVSITNEPDRSVVARCLAEARPVLFPSSELDAVVDRELLHLAGGDALACLPLTAGEHNLVMVAGCGVPLTGTVDADHRSLAAIFCAEFARRYVAIEAAGERAQPGARRMIDPERLTARNREITHEINNPLAIVNNYLKILSLRMAEDPQAQHNLGVIQEEIERIGGIVGKFSDLEAGGLLAEEGVDLNGTVRDITAIVRDAQPGVEIELDLGTVTGWDAVHRDRVKQILLNLLKNAVEALGESGRVCVATRGNVNVGGVMYTELKVSDNGPGIPHAVQQRLFEAAGTTKGDDHQGIGLTIVRRLVEEMEGVVSCETKEGEGTEFRILIPQARLDN